MTLSSARAVFGLSASATPTSQNVSGSVQIGSNNRTLTLEAQTAIYSLRAVFAAVSNVLNLNLLTNSTSGSTSWVAGAPQEETATAAGTITLAGNASVIVTAAGMTGSPKMILVPVVLGDTAATWAGKVRTALAADTAVSALFTVSGTTTAIILTRKPTNTFTIPVGALDTYAANDTTLNIALANGTCTGITGAATSTNTTAGTASAGVKIYDGDGKDFEGNTVSIANAVYGYLVQMDTQAAGTWVGSNETLHLTAGESLLRSCTTGLVAADATMALTAAAGTAATITVIGQ